MPDTPALDARERALRLCGFALEKKAQDLALLEVGGLTTIADFFIICSGRSDRHVQSIAEGIKEDGRSRGLRPISSEGVARGQWVLMDFSDVLVHVFYEPVRRFYDLDGLWAAAPRGGAARALRHPCRTVHRRGSCAGALARQRAVKLRRQTGSLTTSVHAGRRFEVRVPFANGVLDGSTERLCPVHRRRRGMWD